jgi:predicted transcriptional regulator
MADKFSYTLNLPENEANVLTQLAEEKGMSKNAVMRQALRLYQLIQKSERVSLVIEGETMNIATGVL